MQAEPSVNARVLSIADDWLFVGSPIFGTWSFATHCLKFPYWISLSLFLVFGQPRIQIFFKASSVKVEVSCG